MLALTRVLGLLVRALTRTRRRRIATLAVPALVVFALVAPRAAGGGPPPRTGSLAGSGGSSESGGAGATAGSAPRPTGLPGTTGPAPGPTVRPRPEPAMPAGPARAAAAYVVAANSHDARPGRDAGFLDSYSRAKPYVTPRVLAQITAPSRRGDYLWAQWRAAAAVVTVRVRQVAVPDGAPVPTATEAYARVRFDETVTPSAPGAGAARTTPGAVVLLLRRSPTGTWLVARLLADT